MPKNISNIMTFARNYWMSVIIAIAILYLSLAPGSEFSKIPSFPNEDKLVHFLMYFSLAFVLFWNSIICFGISTMQQRKWWIFMIGIPVLWGGCMELLQQYCTTSRTGDWVDELTNTLGAIAGFFVGRWILPSMLKRRVK